MKTLNIDNYPLLRESGISIVQVTPWNIWQLESRIIQAYKQVFNASAWREWVKCARLCGYKTTYEEAPTVCPECSGEIVDFYSDAEVSEAIWKVMDKSYYQILILLAGWEVGWFWWGWQDTLTTVNTEKFWLSQDKFRLLETWLAQNTINPEWSFFYLSEVGIVPKYRKNWIWANITKLNYDTVKNQTPETDATIVRTSKGSPMYPIQKQIWSTVVFSYNDADNRIILSRKNS